MNKVISLATMDLESPNKRSHSQEVMPVWDLGLGECDLVVPKLSEHELPKALNVPDCPAKNVGSNRETAAGAMTSMPMKTDSEFSEPCSQEVSALEKGLAHVGAEETNSYFSKLHDESLCIPDINKVVTKDVVQCENDGGADKVKTEEDSFNVELNKIEASLSPPPPSVHNDVDLSAKDLISCENVVVDDNFKTDTKSDSGDSGSGRSSPAVYLTYEDLLQATRTCKIILTRCDDPSSNLMHQFSENNRNGGANSKQLNRIPKAVGDEHTKIASKKPVKRSNKARLLTRKTTCVVPIRGKNKARGRPPLDLVVLSQEEMEAIDSSDQLVRRVPGKLQCVLCRQWFDTLWSFAVHLRNHTREHPFRCRKCFMTFRTKYQVLQHAEKYHLLVYGKDEVDFIPGRLELLVRESSRKKVVRNTVGFHKTNAGYRRLSRVLIPQQKAEPHPFAHDFEMLHVMDRDENDNETELVDSEPLKEFIKDMNYQNANSLRFIRMNHPDTNTTVEVERDLLSSFIRPFLNKCGVLQNGEENLYEMHSQLRNVLGMGTVRSSKQNVTNSKGQFDGTGLSPNGLKRKYERKTSYSCQKCELKFTAKHLLHKHIRESHQLFSEDRPFKCLVCGKMYKNKSGLNLHIEDVHSNSGERRFKCSECDSSFKHARSLRSHILGNHDSRRPDAANRRYKCGECDRSFTLRKNLIIHMIDHSGDPDKEVLTCSACNLSYASDEKLQAHILEHGAELIPVVTKLNPQIVNSKLKISGIRKTDSKMKRRLPSSLPSVKVHPRKSKQPLKLRCVSRALKPQKCNLCGAVLAGQASLANHMIVHSGVKRFKCEQCDLKFFFKHNLNQHMKAHRGECHHKCSHCDAAFRTKNGLRFHEKRSHPEILIKQKDPEL